MARNVSRTGLRVTLMRTRVSLHPRPARTMCRRLCNANEGFRYNINGDRRDFLLAERASTWVRPNLAESGTYLGPGRRADPDGDRDPRLAYRRQPAGVRRRHLRPRAPGVLLRVVFSPVGRAGVPCARRARTATILPTV